MHVMAELERLSAKIDCLDEKVTRLRVEVAQKGAIWGALTGGLVAGLGWVLRR